MGSDLDYLSTGRNSPPLSYGPGRRDGFANGLAGCRLGRVVTDAQEDEEGPRNAEHFASYAADKAEALNRAACPNRLPQTTQPGQTDRDQQGHGDRDRGGSR
ncbi:hypothetical protein ACFVH9_37915 [Streptomyces hirsutus]|uniref:hypothetical protein n=1 Tax=Streptomyces hirsutus TaxID=35620 RepID=UPI0036259E39